MNKEIYEKYANLLLETGINISEGQSIKIGAEPIHWDFVNILEELAYKKGAKFVRCEIDHPRSTVIRSQHQKDQYLGTIPTYMEKTFDTYVEEQWAFMRFDGAEDPEIYSEVDQKRNAANVKALRQASKKMMEAAMSGRCRWNVAGLPTPKWAAKVMGGEPNQKTFEAFWKVMIPILRLDREDPAAAWKELSDTLKKRSKFLNDKKLASVHFTGPGTDLNIELLPQSQWVGGAIESTDGKIFFPNLPTEEVFTAPNAAKTNGTVRVTRPVKVLGEAVHNAWFKFDQGQVVDYGADNKGKELLTQYFEIDPKAKFLGEVALVDVSSPIFKSEKIFDSILFDENAACHIALGNGVSMGIQGGDKMKEDELEQLGCNKSLLHTDFMIGSPEVSVTGKTFSGETIQIIDKGSFTI